MVGKNFCKSLPARVMKGVIEIGFNYFFL